LAAAAHLWELGMTARNLTARAIALAMPLGSLPLVFCGASCPQSEHFRQVLAEAIGSPPQLALAAMTGFYLIVWLRGSRFGELAFVCCLALEATIARFPHDGRNLGELQAIPLLLIAVIELLVAVQRRSSFRAIVSLTALGLAAATVEELSAFLGTPEDYLWRISPLVALGVAAAFNDEFAKVVRAIAWPWLTVIATWATAASMIESSALSGQALALVACFALIGVAYWYRERSWQRLSGAMISCTAFIMVGARRFGPSLEDSGLGAGLPWLAWGNVALWAAILVSLAKSGALAHLARAFQRFGDGPGRMGLRE
jgi:hypothetical protein